MNINDIITKIEYTKERSAEELFDWFILKNDELRVWSREHSETEALRKMKHDILSSNKELPDKFAHELMPFAYYAKTYYSNKPSARFKPCCDSEQYDGIVRHNGEEIFVEITNAIDGWKWGLQKELLVENGDSPWEHDIHGVEGNKTKRNRSASDIITSAKLEKPAIAKIDAICKIKELVKEATSNKCKKSMKSTLPYGQNKTILIVTFDDTGFSEKDWDDFVSFKQTKIDSMKHHFIKIILFGWVDKKFIIENPS